MIHVVNKKNIRLTICKDIYEISDIAVKELNTIHKNNAKRFYIIPGGSTPIVFYTILATKIKDWKNTIMILSDERCVNDTNSFSNYGMVTKNLIDKIKNLDKPEIVSLLERNKNKSENKINEYAKKILKLYEPNLSILGVGSDGHIAGLFHLNKEIYNMDHKRFLITKNESEMFKRISLTFTSLMKSKRLIFLISGEKKSKIIAKSLEINNSKLISPFQYILTYYNNPINIICDKLSARMLKNIYN